MSATWDSNLPPDDPYVIGVWGWVRAALRGLILGLLVFGGLVLLLVVRLVERPLFGLRRPITPFITQFVCRSAFCILGMAEVTLLNQPFVVNPDLTVGAAATEAGATVTGFVRLEVGEGIEKKVEDFAAEVAKAAQG